jgi:hypothetical protein
VIGFLPILLRRKYFNKISCGVLGRANSRVWLLMGLLSVALALLANFINALNLQTLPDFADIPIGTLVLFWCTRPRTAWLATIYVLVDFEESMYFSSGASSLLTEVILQCLAAVHMGTTVHFSKERGFYRLHALDGVPGAKFARMMYGGAILWLVGVFFTLIFGVFAVSDPITLCCRVFPGPSRRVTALLALLRAKFTQRQTDVHVDQPPNISQNGRRRVQADTYATGLVSRTHRMSLLHIFFSIPVFFDLPWPDDIRNRNPNWRNAPWYIALQSMGIKVSQLEMIQYFYVALLVPLIGQWIFWSGFVQLARKS